MCLFLNLNRSSGPLTKPKMTGSFICMAQFLLLFFYLLCLFNIFYNEYKFTSIQVIVIRLYYSSYMLVWCNQDLWVTLASTLFETVIIFYPQLNLKTGRKNAIPRISRWTMLSKKVDASGPEGGLFTRRASLFVSFHTARFRVYVKNNLFGGNSEIIKC